MRLRSDMSGILVIVAFAIGLALALGMWAYGKRSPKQVGRVRPDAPPSAEEERRAEGSDGREVTGRESRTE